MGNDSPTILAINPGHDGAAVLVQEGQLLFSIEQEKNSHRRHAQLTGETLLDVFGRLDQRADVAVEQGLERAWLTLAHDGAAALKATALEARKRLLSASMIISAKAGCWLTR